VVAVQRHELDEAHLVGGRAGELGERDRLLLREVAERDRVHLDRPHLRERADRLEAAQHLRKRVAARELEEAVALERVDRHVHARDAGVHQRLGVALEQIGVRREREVLDAVHAREHRYEPRKLAPHERLAAREPQVGHAHARHHRHQPLDLLEAQHLVAVEPGEPVRGHAVLAAEVAAVGHGHA
jgi:hypothetical protein